jgi:hypothetical protein
MGQQLGHWHFEMAMGANRLPPMVVIVVAVGVQREATHHPAVSAS